MRHTHVALLALAAVLALGACQSAKSSDADEKLALEKRVHELEQKLAKVEASAAPAPAASTPPPVRRAARRVGPTGKKPPDKVVRAAEPRQRQPIAPNPSPAVPTAEVAPTHEAAQRAEGAPPVELPLPPARSADEEAPPRAQPPARRAHEPVVLPEGTELRLVLETSLSSERSGLGDGVVARVERATGPDGEIALPGGTSVEGQVVDVRRAGRVQGRALIAVQFDRIVLRGERRPLDTVAVVVRGPESHKKDALLVGGGAAIGAFLGAVTGGSAGKGALLGAAAGSGAALTTRGAQVEVPAGTRWTVTVSRR
jgi:type IV secretory pathway VirB10-like protein